MRVRLQKGRAAEQLCLHCGNQAHDWANVSGEYRRDLDDFIPLCQVCHYQYDRGGAQNA